MNVDNLKSTNSKHINQKNNFVKKILLKIKENFISDDLKIEIKKELLEPFYIEIINYILPHYIIFIFLFLIIIILLLSLIIMISNSKNKL